VKASGRPGAQPDEPPVMSTDFVIGSHFVGGWLAPVQRGKCALNDGKTYGGAPARECRRVWNAFVVVWNRLRSPGPLRFDLPE
jgi:hypothetical protein